MSLATIHTLLEKLNQLNLYPLVEKLSQEKQQALCQQLKTIDPIVLQQQRVLLRESSQEIGVITPFQAVQKIEQNEIGKKLLSQGKVGCLMVAGGQGTRLGYDGPKGCFPITPARHKTLFQFFAERVSAASLQVGRALPWAIMTSPLNEADTRAHFASISLDNVSIFSQGVLPFLDNKGNMFFEEPGKIAMGPDGNGSVIHAFLASGIADKWEKSGIELVTFIMVDNPLADPFDAALIGAHAKANVDVTIKCISRINPHEKVGVLVNQNGAPTILEYSEMPQAEWNAYNENGTFRHSIANISLFCFSLSFLKSISKQALPLHKAFKAAAHLDQEGQIISAKEPYAWKFERFIFDLLPYATSLQALLYPREKCFAPLKNAKGDQSILSTQEALTRFDRATLETLTGQKVPFECLEIDPKFYYPTETLLAKWQDKKIPSIPYIES